MNSQITSCTPTIGEVLHTYTLFNTQVLVAVDLVISFPERRRQLYLLQMKAGELLPQGKVNCFCSQCMLRPGWTTLDKPCFLGHSL